ncbi:hypothetical protein S83_051377, partial [Arachis hypogaea]
HLIHDSFLSTNGNLCGDKDKLTLHGLVQSCRVEQVACGVQISFNMYTFWNVTERKVETIQRLQRRGQRILMTTELVERGIDIEWVNIVINYDIPDSADNYLHR